MYLIILFWFFLMQNSQILDQENVKFIQARTVEDIKKFSFDSIPRYKYTSVPDLSNLDIRKKKKAFINLILPSILIEKERIKFMREYVFENKNGLPSNTKSKLITDYCGCNDINSLLMCLADQPTSIILAQAAIESGWGTSRFFTEGNNLFGIHSYNFADKKMRALNSEEPVFVKKYDSISESIYDYLRNLAKSHAYQEFIENRFLMKKPTELIMYLEKYSIRRHKYTNDLKKIMVANNFNSYDSLKLESHAQENIQ